MMGLSSTSSSSPATADKGNGGSSTTTSSNAAVSHDAGAVGDEVMEIAPEDLAAWARVTSTSQQQQDSPGTSL